MENIYFGIEIMTSIEDVAYYCIGYCSRLLQHRVLQTFVPHSSNINIIILSEKRLRFRDALDFCVEPMALKQTTQRFVKSSML